MYYNWSEIETCRAQPRTDSALRGRFGSNDSHERPPKVVTILTASLKRQTHRAQQGSPRANGTQQVRVYLRFAAICLGVPRTLGCSDARTWRG